MSHLRLPRCFVPFIRRLLLTSAMATTTACMSTRVERGPVHESLPSPGRNGEVRLTLKTGAEFRLFHMRIEGDSVLGWTSPQGEAPEFRVAVAKADVLEVAVRKDNAFKTILAVTAGVYGAALIIAVALLLSLFAG